MTTMQLGFIVIPVALSISATLVAVGGASQVYLAAAKSRRGPQEAGAARTTGDGYDDDDGDEEDEEGCLASEVRKSKRRLTDKAPKSRRARSSTRAAITSFSLLAPRSPFARAMSYRHLA